MQKLIDKGYAYAAGGDVYFDVSKDHDYGKLCNRDPEQLEAGSRIEVSDKKRNPGDFALWKGAKPGEPAEVQYDSPWGKGRPGWHIECSVMSQALLGDTLDIHGGGLDLQFPHHENELAQSESATGKEFARVWMHNGLLKPKGGGPKMGGSLNNAVNMTEVFQQHAPETIRMLLLGTHYRSPIEYSDERLEEVHRSLQGFSRFFERAERVTGRSFFDKRPVDGGGPDGIGELRQRFFECMDDDFNTGGAVGVLFELLAALNRFADRQNLDAGGSGESKAAFEQGVLTLRELSSILGLFWEPPTKASLGGDDALVGGLVQLLIDVRNGLRADAKAADKGHPLKAALFGHTDTIRKRLADLGVTLEDGPSGTRWRVGS
jgi:cysteinyl-tRNA synthetase